MASKKEKSLGRGIAALFAENGVDAGEEPVGD